MSHSYLNVWKYLEQNVLFPKGLNWLQHWVGRFGLFPELAEFSPLDEHGVIVFTADQPKHSLSNAGQMNKNEQADHIQNRRHFARRDFFFSSAPNLKEFSLQK